MLTQEQVVEIRVIARRGMGIRQIARELGCSRNTVRRYVEDPQAARYGPRPARATKLAPFEAHVCERIEAAKPRWIPAVVLLREIQDRGYAGGLTQLKMFINPLKRVRDDPVVRFETPPGVQMQADFTVIRRGRDPLLAFVATLGYSRMSFVRFTTGEDAATLCACLREALLGFGGVPQHVLFDNAKTVIVERNAYGDGAHRWHAGVLRLADEFGFGLRVCRPYRAKTKGKVERFNGYLKGSFLVPLAATLKSSGLKLDAVAANVHIGRWLSEVANARVHATTKERPDRRLVVERAALLPLPTSTPLPLPAPRSTWPLPVESLQHPLSVYAVLTEVPA
ncbi:IS21 family transposase [Methyloceanibacter sp.]|uniref:IS21 family transposase n=1 Tax=Methyloceanibacter sp. TaxID=1965321 RepID=UPI003D6C9BD3